MALLTVQANFLKEYLAKGTPDFQALISSGHADFAKAAVQNNFAKAEIYFQTLNIINIVQTPAITVAVVSLMGTLTLILKGYQYC